MLWAAFSGVPLGTEIELFNSMDPMYLHTTRIKTEERFR